MTNITISGAALNTNNLGCLALTYSAIRMLEEVSSIIDDLFVYNILDISYERRLSNRAKELMCEMIGVDNSRIQVHSIGNTLSLKKRIRHVADNAKRKRILRDSNVLFDLTSGDSFSDIYGVERLHLFSEPKVLACNMNIPLIMGPQTIGPFKEEASKDYAKEILNSASLIMVRDSLSQDCVREISGRESILTTDLAFGLPYDRYLKRASDEDGCFHVGVNPSGLLASEAFENSGTSIALMANYDTYIESLIDCLIKQDMIVHLIPHVSVDMKVINRVAAKFRRVKIHHPFNNPIDTKNLISTMDLFIGSRMHATIASLSSGVPVIPVAYSRKFAGLFDSLDYQHTLDLTNLSTDEALAKTIGLLDARAKLVDDVERSRIKAERIGISTRDNLVRFFEKKGLS